MFLSVCNMHVFIISCGNHHPLFIKNLSHISTDIYKLHVGVALSCALRRVRNKKEKLQDRNVLS